MTCSISLLDVSKTYSRQVPAVDRLSLEVAAGEFLVLLGPSGCGKSTVLRMIAGLEEITSGDLLLNGEYANHLTPAERRLAMVFQNFALYPQMTSRENIGFPLRFEMEPGKAAPRITETAEMLGISDLLDRYPAHLSGGERQRVAMARAIGRRPSVFLMDEPLSNLDAKLRSHLRAEISRLTRELGVTTVYVTHDQAEAMSLGDRVAIMRDGVLQQVGTPHEAYRLPENVFVASFVGTPRINLLRATVHAPVDGGMWIDFGRQRLALPQPLGADHQMLRIQQNRPVVVGLRAEAVRIAEPGGAREGEGVLTGIVEHLEYQGHETLVHLDTGSRPASVPGPQSPRAVAGHGPGTASPRGSGGGLSPALSRAVHRAGEAVRHRAGAGTRRRGARGGGPAGLAQPPERAAGDLVVRTGPETRIRPGDRVPLLIDIRHLYVFDRSGARICPAPALQPVLEP